MLYSSNSYSLSQALHQGASVLNSMLDVIQPCFVQSERKILGKAYIAWRVLIDNFAREPYWRAADVTSNDAGAAVYRMNCYIHIYVCAYD